jgi:hypothetical protein
MLTLSGFDYSLRVNTYLLISHAKLTTQGSRYRTKKSPCEGWHYFLVGQSSSHLVIWVVACIFLPRVIYENVNIVFIELYRIHKVFWKWFSYKVIHFGLKNLSYYSITNKIGSIGKGGLSCTVQKAMLTKATFNQTNFWFIFFSFLWHRIWVLIFNLFIHVYAKVGHSKIVSDFYRSASKSDWYFILVEEQLSTYFTCFNFSVHVYIRDPL